MNLTKKEKQRLRAKLQTGDIRRISNMVGKSRYTVIRWFNDESNSSEIAEALSLLLKKRVSAIESLRNSL